MAVFPIHSAVCRRSSVGFYDANGQRVMTVEPGGKTTYFPFPGYSEEMGTTVTARRVTYTIAGQAVASRVQIISPASNTLYRLYTDHLGSTVTQSTMSGGTVGGTNTYYLPYGGYRGTPPTQTLTDRDFTGQRENRELGLIYMNSRYYVPAIGRFISADTIVPDQRIPQTFNRYSYVYNNPTKYNDPTGHCGAEAAASSDDLYYVGYAEYQECVIIRGDLEQILGHSVKGIWHLEQMMAFFEGAFMLNSQGFQLSGNLSADDRRSILQNFVGYFQSSSKTSLEISALTVEFAHIIGGNIEDLIDVLSGHQGDGLQGCGWFCSEPSNSSVFSTADYLKERASGFNETYGDPDPNNNQVHHTWYWLQVAYYHPNITAYIGNCYHEYIQDAGGQSNEDYAAGIWGIRAGSQLQKGNLSLLDFAVKIRRELGE